MTTTAQPVTQTPAADADALPQAGGSYTRLPDGTLVPTDQAPPVAPPVAPTPLKD